MKYLFFAIFLVFDNSGSFAQSNIIKGIPVNLHLGQGGGLDYGYEIREQEDGYLILNYHQFWPVPLGKDWNGLVKIDFEGNVQWIRDYFYLEDSAFGISDAYQKMAFIGDTLFLSHNRRNNDYDFPGILALNRFTGDTLWTKYFDLGNEFEEDKLFIEKDGLLYLVVGDRFVYSQKAKLLCFNSQGNLLWEKELLTDENVIRPAALIPSSNGGFWLGSAIWDLGNTYDSWAVFVELDSLGNEIWRKELEKEERGEEHTVAKVWECRNGDIIGVSILDDFNNSSTDPYPPLVHRIAPNGDILWTHSFAVLDTRHIYQIRECENGDIVGVGYSGLGEDYQPASIGGGGWIFRFQADGELLYDRLIIDTLLSPFKGMAFSDFIEKEDGSFVLTGMIFQAFDDGNVDVNILFMTLDADGCFYPDCEDLQLITKVDFISNESSQLSVSPNPFTDQLNIQLPEELFEDDFIIEVFNNVGQLLFSKKIRQKSDTLNITFPYLSKGSYLLKVKNKSWFGTTTIIKQ